MRDRPSLTAFAVAISRGMSAHDPIAPALLPAPFGRMLVRARELRDRHPTLAWVFERGAFGLAEHIPLRTGAIDEAVREAISEGARQLVVLGAGLDARAWRLTELAEVIVYEVDHPATQPWKRDHVRSLPRLAADVRFVSVDFTKDPLTDRLVAAGYIPTEPVVIVWEGVTPYLPREAIEATLEAIRALARARTTLAMTYGTPSLASAAHPRLTPLVRGAFDVLGEPLLGLMDPLDARELATRHGFTLLSDTGSEDWARAQDEPVPRRTISERLLLATVSG